MRSDCAAYFDIVFDTSDPAAIVAVAEDTKGFDEHRLLRCQRIDDWPEDVTFTVKGEHVEDYLVSPFHWELISDRARRVLQECRAKELQFLPARVVKTTGEVVGRYWVLNVLQSAEALDWDHTRWGNPKVKYSEEPWWDIIRYAVRAEAAAGSDVFRLSIKGKLDVSWFLSRRLKECLVNAGTATGFKFKPVQAFSDSGIEFGGRLAGARTTEESRPKPGSLFKRALAHHELKKRGLEKLLGKGVPPEGYAVIGFQTGGPLDLYQFPDNEIGTAFATLQLIEPNGSGPRPSSMIGTYELVAFTRRSTENDEESGLKAAEGQISTLLLRVANFAYDTELNPMDTVELPADAGQMPRFAVFDEFSVPGRAFRIGRRRHGLLQVVEVFKVELEYARKHGSEALLDRLKASGNYPFCDLDRPPVV